MCVCAFAYLYTHTVMVMEREVLATLPCLAITGSGTLLGRYPQWRVARNETVQQANEKRKRKCSMGASWSFYLLAVCPVPPSMRKISLPLLVSKSFPALYTAHMNHPLSPSSALLPVVRLVSHLSLLQRLLKVHQDVLLHKSFIAPLRCPLFPLYLFLRLSQQEISVMLGDYTCKSDTHGFRKREKKRGKTAEGERDEGLQIQISRMTSEVSDFSTVKCLKDHLSPACFIG